MSLLYKKADAATACPCCGEVLRVPLTAANRRAKCCRCGERFTIPAKQELIDQTVAYLMSRREREWGDDTAAGIEALRDSGD
ncbi:MAG: hypothetical protein AAF797_07715 [Planctomycetota bacterium]